MEGYLIPISREVHLSKVAPGKVATTLDLSKPDNQRLCANAINRADTILKRLVGKTIEVTDLVVHYKERADDETGEIGPGVRAVFILADGSTVATSSPSAIRALLTPCMVCDLTMPYDPPQTFKVRSQPSNNGVGDWLTLDWEGP